MELMEHQLEIQRTAKRFADKEVVPIADKLDQEEGFISEELIQKMAELDVYGMIIPEEWGGVGLDTTSLAIVTEELCRGSLAVGSLPMRNVITGWELYKHGTEDQKKRFLPLIASGKIQTSSLGTEPEAGSDAANVQTTAKKVGDKYILNGTKVFGTFAKRADLLFVYARTNPDVRPKHRGISCFIVEKPRNEFSPPNLTGDKIPTCGYHGMGTYTVYMEDLEVPAENLLGGVEGKGFYQLMGGYEIARITFAARCVGLVQAAYDKALEYSKQRVQFEQPISKFQAIRHRLAVMATDVMAARQLTYYAARLFDTGKRCDLEAGMAKLFASEVCMKHTWNALQMHGGYGYTKEYSVNRFWRDAGLLPIGEGTSEVQMDVIAKRILGER